MQLREARLHQLTNLKRELDSLQQELSEGTPYNVADDNLGESVRVELESMISRANSLKNSRQKQINNLIEEINALCADLGEGPLPQKKKKKRLEADACLLPADPASHTQYTDYSRSSIGMMEAHMQGLQKLKTDREIVLSELLGQLNHLWERLMISHERRDRVLSKKGLTLSNINLLKEELASLHVR